MHYVAVLKTVAVLEGPLFLFQHPVVISFYQNTVNPHPLKASPRHEVSKRWHPFTKHFGINLVEPANVVEPIAAAFLHKAPDRTQKKKLLYLSLHPPPAGAMMVNYPGYW
ncbi:MAG: hypothetical protein CMF50_01665 [Legionellales bacterium]|nr:hypothetical protein [Legionellales bacterium]